ncbi:MAG: DUF3667 domain-containing protein [Gammaproteobacteria bacterium]|jgi:hypothetical protein|nr:hypothetical protein [Chromatiales bacterium]MDP6675904.1 DUF3667 domain-containing protein [Gammaproteobacteria bacterium]
MMRADEYCKNCGATLSGLFCASCGQRVKTPIVSLGEFFSDALGDSEYFAGRRGHYLPPFRIYLILSFLFFIITSIFGMSLDITVDESLPGKEQTSGIESVDSDEADNFSCQDIRLDGIGFLNGSDLEARVHEACEKIIQDSGDSMSSALVDNFPMMMFFFIPLVALLMKFLYLLSRRKYVEHLLFLFHYHAYIFLILSVIVIMGLFSRLLPSLDWLTSSIAGLCIFYFPVYLLIAIKRVYGQSWLMTNIKYLLLLLGYAVTLFISFAGTTVYTALTL